MSSVAKCLKLRLHVEVDQESIDEARCKQQTESYVVCRQCMLAVALNRATGHDWYVTGLAAIVSIGKDFSASYWLPDLAMLRLCEFDLGDHVDPFAFDLELYRVTSYGESKDQFHEAILELFPAAVFDGDQVYIDGQVLDISNTGYSYTCSHRS